MKNNNMLKKIILLLTLFNLFINSQSKAEDFFFEGNEILILENGNKLKSKNGVKITSSDNVIITGQTFEYDKVKKILIMEGLININDKENQTIINAEKIFYNKDSEIIRSFGKSTINVEDKYKIDSKDIIFDRKSKKIFSKSKTRIDDAFNNKISSEKIMFEISDKILKGTNVTIEDIEGNETHFVSFFSDLKNNQFFGKDIKINFNKNLFGNKQNDPRLYGNVVKGDNNETILSKGVFTTCKKKDGCPPWQIKAEKVIHDKQKKIINYKNAWLEVYDKPILYFPKFFHPDPTVKRQSGFLIPTFSDSGNIGSSVQIPYFKVLSDNKDLTFTPRIMSGNNLLFQNEYRQEEKNSSYIMDFGLFTSAMSDGEQSSKSHFFANSESTLDNTFFDETLLNINLETVSNDTYLKKYDLTSPLIKSDNTLNSFIKFDGYNDDSSISIDFETYENLSLKTNDRYEYIYPNISFNKNINNLSNLNGDLNFSSNIYQKQYETNKYQQSFTNQLRYTSDTNYKDSGVLNNFIINLRNSNTRDKTGFENNSSSKNQLLTELLYKISYPLKKQTDLYYKTLNPTVSFRYSPNITKNISDDDQVIGIENINSFDRINSSGGVEGGQSATYGIEYSRSDFDGNEKVNFELYQVYRDKKNEDLPAKTSLNQKYSDLIGKLKINTSDNLSLQYNFMADNNLKDTNLNSIAAELKVNNFVTKFEFLEERNLVGSKSYLSNNTTLNINNNNSILFSTRKNKEIDMTEFYNLVYQYENDCLKAALEYNKQFYNDDDIKPEEELFFSITIIPFSKMNSKNLN